MVGNPSILTGAANKDDDDDDNDYDDDGGEDDDYDDYDDFNGFYEASDLKNDHYDYNNDYGD